MAKKIPEKLAHSPRFLAVELLTDIRKQGAYSNIALNQVIKKTKMSDKDSRLLTELVYGTLSRRLTLEYYLAPFVEKAKKVDPWVQELLLVSLYQIEFLDKIPTHAILNEAVKIGKNLGNPGIGKFVNGVLRTILRQGLPKTADILDDLTRMSVELSLPRWLIEKLVGELGVSETEKLGQSLFQPARSSARVNTLKTTADEVLELLAKAGIRAEKSQISPVGIVAEKGFLAGSSLFKEGYLTIQDESSMLVAPALKIAGDHQVLDACAAPGGKTTQIATYLHSQAGGRIIALDLHRKKLRFIDENAERLGVSEVVTPLEMDARNVKEQFPDEEFDRILVDAPCSGLGLLRRKPDIRYTKSLADIEKLPEIQLAILESVADKLKVGGRLVYSTCTIMPEENQQVVNLFLKRHKNYKKVSVPVKTMLQSAVKEDMLQLYPHTFGTDGFFISCLVREN